MVAPTSGGRTVVFAGPSLPPEERHLLDADYRPPVELAAVYRAVCGGAVAVGLIDGTYERVPAVFHKEILWALDQSVAVYGAASMGALRAAELAVYGMRGIGKVFELFRDGTLEDDDEVAVVHAPAEGGFRPLSVAMVDMRVTLQSATAAGVIAAETRDRLLALAKGCFYPERAYDSLLAAARQRGLPVAELHALEGWLPANLRSQKAEDAALLLRVMARDRAAGRQHRRAPAGRFEPTVFWDRVVAEEREREVVGHDRD